MPQKFWKVINQTENSADLQLYGDISSQSWLGDEVTPQQFADDLKNLGDVDTINVHINSGGGDVFAGVAIYNMLKSHQASVNVHIDGLAASIASIIAMAGDTITMPAGSMMMIHNPATVARGVYGAGDLRKVAGTLDTIKESMIGIYAAKCGKTTDAISQIMDAETWYTSTTAVAEGFATDTDETVAYAACLDKENLIINGVSFKSSLYKHLPPITNAIKPQVVPKVQTEPIKNVKEVEFMDINELKAKYPDVYAAVYVTGQTDERARMKAIDEIAMPGNEAIVNAARYDTGISAEAVAMQIIRADKVARASVLQNIATDVATGNVNQIQNEPVPDAGAAEDAERAQMAADMAAAANNRLKGVQ